MGIYTLVPVQEAFCIDGVTDLQIFNSLVNIAVLVTQIRLNQEGVGFAVAGNFEVQVVALRTGAVPVVQIGNIVAVCILTSRFYSQIRKGNMLVLMIDQFVCAKQVSNINCRSDIFVCALYELKGCIHQLNFAGPLGFVTGYADFYAGNELFIIFFGTSHVIQEVCAVLVLCINSSLVFLPGLFCLNVALDGHFAVQICCNIICIG